MSDFTYIISLAKKHTNEIGFIPKTRMEIDYAKGRFFVEYENDEPCGFLYFGGSDFTLKIYQACIQYDAQRRHHGFNLVAKAIHYAAEKGFSFISCWCADGLEANKFWQECGFKWSGERDKKSRRGWKHNLWVFHLPQPKQMQLGFWEVPKDIERQVREQL